MWLSIRSLVEDGKEEIELVMALFDGLGRIVRIAERPGGVHPGSQVVHQLQLQAHARTEKKLVALARNLEVSARGVLVRIGGVDESAQDQVSVRAFVGLLGGP